MAARTKCGWAKLREYGEFLEGKKNAKNKSVHMSYVWPAISYGSEAWCLYTALYTTA